MKKTQKLLLIVLTSLTIYSCKDEIEELGETNVANDLKTTEEIKVIEYKGLKVNHRFNTPIEELELNLDETGNKTMYTHIKKSKTLTPKVNGINSSKSLLELPNEDIIIEATKEIVELFPYNYEKEPLFQRHEIHNILDTLPVGVQITLLQNKTIASILKQESKDFKAHQEKIKEFHKVQEKRKLDMIHQDFKGLSDEQIENTIEIIDEYYKKNMNYEILKTSEETKSAHTSKTPRVNKISKTNYYPSNEACILWKSGTLANALTVRNAGEDATNIANNHFPNMSTTDSRNDAMRHIMWNVLLAKYYFTLSSARSTRTGFAKRVADANEECGRNPIDIKEMDYHNNVIGRNVYWDNTGTKKVLGITVGVDEASTATYTNDALNRVNNKSCYIVKKYDNNTFPENQLPKDTEKSPENIRQQILNTNNETVVYINGPIANNLNLTLNELMNIDFDSLKDFSICERNNVSKPWKETQYYYWPMNQQIYHAMGYFAQFYDSNTGLFKIPYYEYNSCVRDVTFKCFKL